MLRAIKRQRSSKGVRFGVLVTPSLLHHLMRTFVRILKTTDQLNADRVKWTMKRAPYP